MIRILVTACVGLLVIAGGPAWAQDTVKIGVINAYSGQFADPGAQLDAGIKLYMQMHGDEVAGKKIEVIRKDVGGIAPDVAKRLAEELVVRDGVDILAGFLLTPNALAAADVSAEAQKFMVVMNATTPVIITKSPYMIRTSATASQINYNFGTWVADKGVKQIYTMVTDYGPGIGSGEAFEMAFKEKGGEVVGQDRTPVVNPDFAPFVQRVAEAKPEALYIWVPGGTQPPALGKALAERGVTPANTKIYSQGELTDDAALEAMGDVALGIVTAYHYNVHRDDPLNDEFVKAYKEANDGRDPDIYSIGAYDGMHAIYKALEATGGDASGEALVSAAKGLAWDSPRGPMSIDPETRDVVQTIWIREVQELDGKPANVIIDQIENAKSPGP
jgi:branched-chain amino acid transport system substrate-binding protein